MVQEEKCPRDECFGWNEPENLLKTCYHQTGGTKGNRHCKYSSLYRGGFLKISNSLNRETTLCARDYPGSTVEWDNR